ncbi:MAG: hypothetical protein LBC35_02995 [Coriobacteriales bacterium]|nr:hypothetical protein [Coriobacteriales bacterium]
MNPDFRSPISAAGAPIRFGTDGWRAIIGADFNTANLARLTEAAARVYREDCAADAGDKPTLADDPADDLAENLPGVSADGPTHNKPNTLIVGYDCRENAGRYAVLVGVVLERCGFDVLISDSYCPTPALCWSVAQNAAAVGGIMLTSSHNPAEYLGVKLRMSDGGASPKAFSDRVERALRDELPTGYETAVRFANAAKNGTPECPATLADLTKDPTELGDLAVLAENLTLGEKRPAARATAVLPQEKRPAARTTVPSAPLGAPGFAYADLMTPYLAELVSLVDAPAIAAAGLEVVVDPMYGAGRHYLAQTLRDLGVTVTEIHNTDDPSFAGLHPEPILPWIQEGLDTAKQRGACALFVTDGDADRIGAGTGQGAFVNPHLILALLCAHLAEDKGRHGRVVRTLSGSNLVKRQCERLGLELTTTPIGFKWIYEQMLCGDVLIGGEESGGIGIPSHVRERDGLLMALLLTELMAQKRQTLAELVQQLTQALGELDYARRDLDLEPAQKDAFMTTVVAAQLDAGAYQPLFTAIGEQILNMDYRDGIKFNLSSDGWLLMRPSGTEPLVRVYAEAAGQKRLDNLLDLGSRLVQGKAQVS